MTGCAGALYVTVRTEGVDAPDALVGLFEATFAASVGLFELSSP